MQIRELLEGGWDTTVTQGTVIKPATVKITLAKVQQFVTDFNRWLSATNQGPVALGRPTGSGTYHEIDSKEHPDKVYGDIDLQMIAPDVPNSSYGQYTTHWNRLADEFVKSNTPAYVHTSESKPGHPIFQIGPDQYVQVDFMWHPPHLRDWGAARVTPERGIKGLLTGNMYSVLGELLDMSIQHAGVQLKTIDGMHVPFSKQKGTVVKTISTDPRSFIYDIFMNEYEQITGQDPSTAKVDPLLDKFRGNDPSDVKISKLINAVKGLARSFQINGMYGKQDLAAFSDAHDFLNKFVQRYEEKAMTDVNAKKRDKAETPEAKARAEADRQKVLSGLDTVKGLFNL
jgi:hypothetical protein